jgi:phage gp36-like protein
MTDALAIDLHALATETASGTGASVDIGAHRSCLKLDLLIESMAGTKLECTVQHAGSAAGPWETLGPLPAVTAAVTRSALFVNVKQFVRLSWVLTGADAKFRVSGEAHALFASPTDVEKYAFPDATFAKLKAKDIAECCLAGTDEAASYFVETAFGPLTKWGEAMTMQVAYMVGYHLMGRRGFQPQGSDDVIVKRYDDAIKWLRMIGKGEIRPPALVDGTPTKFKNAARVTSRSSDRGW